MNPSRRWQRNESHHVASSLTERSNPNTKAKQTPTNQTQRCSSKPNTEVFIKKKKKKKKSSIHKPKPNPVTHGHVAVVVVIVAARSSSSSSLARSPLITDRRSEIGERRSLCLCPVLGALSGPPSRNFALFLSDSLSVSLSLSH